jgi:hypothetical protein
MGGPQLKACARLTILKFHILRNPGQTASLPLTALQDCQLKKNYMTINCNLSYNVYFFIALHNYFVFFI